MKNQDKTEDGGVKSWFEHNFLDGDKVQQGQMLSSELCLEAIEEAVLREREECARISEEYPSSGRYVRDDVGNYAILGGKQIAEAIRNRGK